MSHDDNTSDNWKEMLKNLEEQFDQLDEEQKEILKDIFQGNVDYNEILDKQWYRYDRPNYEEISKPVAKWLKPLTEPDLDYDIYDICQKLAEKAAKMSKKKMTTDLQNFVYRYLAFLNNDIYRQDEFEDNEYAFTLFAAFWLMEHFQLESLLDTALETLKQPSEVLNFIYSISDEENGTIILYQLGKNQMDKLYEFLQTPGFLPSTKTIVFDALASIYYYEPTLKLKALHYISNYLKICQQIGLQGGDMTNVDHYANTLAMVNAKETLPLLKIIYDTTDVPCIEINGYDDLVEKMNDMENVLDEVMPTMDNIIFDIQDFARGDDDFDDDFDEDFDDIFGDDDIEED